MIKAADETEPREVARNMHLELPVIFRILYGCGLRVSEVVGYTFIGTRASADLEFIQNQWLR